MPRRLFNFSAGPAVLPVEVLEEARENLLSLGETGVGIMEHSHRGKAFMAVYEEAVSLCRELADIPDNYHVLFLQGGASSQFFMVPMNLLRSGATADYLVTGAWSKKAVTEAQRFGTVHTACSSADRNFCYIPHTTEQSERPAYVHYTSNNTIFGTQFAAVPDVSRTTNVHNRGVACECSVQSSEKPVVASTDRPRGRDLICDMSSDIFSRPVDVSKYGLIYAGAQKNLGPSGVTLVIIRDDLVQRGPDDLPTMLQYRTHVNNGSMFNTPPTFGIYMMGLVFKWIQGQGGLEALARANTAKASQLYDFIDGSGLFQGTADIDSRSQMNVTFIAGDDEMNARFIAEAEAAGFSGLKGHRSVGGMRASIYNAFPAEGVAALVEFMRQFEAALTPQAH